MDPVTLSHARQAGATGIVSALHDQYDGRAWALDDILLRKRKIEANDLAWAVCESIPVDDSIKLRSGSYRQYIDNWKISLRNLAEAGVRTVCYNFRPILDWSRTDLRYRLPSTGFALRFDRVDLAVYDVFI